MEEPYLRSGLSTKDNQTSISLSKGMSSAKTEEGEHSVNVAGFLNRDTTDMTAVPSFSNANN